MEFLMVMVTFLILAITVVAWQFINSFWLKPKKLEHLLRQQGFHGNPYRPIHGDAPEIMKMAQTALSKPMPTLSHDLVPRLMPFELQTIKQHGKNFFMWHGRKPKVVITKAEMIRKILVQYKVFRKQPPGTRSSFGLVMRDGEDWAKVRKIINPTFQMDKLKKMLPMMEVSCDMMLRKWEEIISTNGSCEVDVFSSLETMAADVIARTSFGSSYEEGKRLFQLEEESIRLKFQNMRSKGYYVPGWRHFPTKINREIKALDNENRKVVTSIIDNRKRLMKEGSGAFKDDLLSVMLESNKEHQENEGVGLSMEELILECRLFLLAGKDTITSLLTWTLVLLSQYQDWQTKARDEVWHYFGRDKTPDAEILRQLKIVPMILNETLRFYPPVTRLSRVIAHETKVMNLTFTHEMDVNLATLLVHRDSEIWGDDANEFNPARFSEGVSTSTNVSGSFLPFGGGPRVCIGQQFALMEAKLTLAKILQQFSFELSSSYVHAPIPFVGLLPQFGAPLIFKKI